MSADDNIFTWLEQLMAESTPPTRRAEIETRLAGSEAGRRALARVRAWRAGPAEEGFDLRAGVMDALPSGPLTVYRAMAAVVVRAWADPAFREVLRRDPPATLAAEGVELPTGVTVRIVPAAEGRLPGAGEVTLPIPAASQPAVMADEAVRRLRRTPFGWIWGVPWEAAQGPTSLGAPAAHTLRPRWPWLPGRRGVSLALAGIAAAVVLWVAAVKPGPGSVSGTAVGGGAMGPAVAAAGVLVLVALIAFLRRRRP